MRVKDELLGCPLIEISMPLCGIAKWENRRVYNFCNWQAIMQDSLHKLAVILQDRGLAGIKDMRLCPPKGGTPLQITVLPCLILGARVFGNIETGDSDRTSCPDDRHQGIENGRWSLFPI